MYLGLSIGTTKKIDQYARTLIAYLSYFKTFGWLYQALIKVEGNEVEMNFIDGDDLRDLTILDVLDLFENPNRKIDHLIDDGNVYYDSILGSYLVLY